MSMAWKKTGQSLVYNLFNPFVKLLLKIGITPNMVSVMGLLLNILAAAIFIYGAEQVERNDHSIVAWAGLIILVGGLMDMIDGRLARIGDMESKYGALFDSVLDRYSEMVMFLGICYYLIAHDYFLSGLFAFIALIGSVMVSYTRARAEALGADASVGLMQRPERVLIIGLSAIATGFASTMLGASYKIDVDWLPFPLFEPITAFTFPIFILAIAANITAIRRLFHAKTELQKEEA